MTIDSQYLRVFCALARHLNMSRAAEELELTPSGISHCLKSLETDLGCRLFERSSRKVSLTPAGEEFRGEADDILRKMSAARTRLKSWSDWRCGQLRLVAESTGCQYILPAALREFRESFPKFTVRIDPCSTRPMIDALTEERADLALLVCPQNTPGLEMIPLAEDELHYLVHPHHPWVTQRKPHREDVTKQNLILPERISETYTLIESYFRQDGVTVEPFIEMGNDSAIKEMVQLNLGIGLLPRWLVASEVAQGTLATVPLGRRHLRRRWGILHARARRLTFPESVFVDLCRKVTQSLVSSED